jgi:hypothetical protein
MVVAVVIGTSPLPVAYAFGARAGTDLKVRPYVFIPAELKPRSYVCVFSDP